MSLTQPQIALPERYRMLHRVATGGMATVYAAADGVLGREVAIKLLAGGLAADDAARQRFTREARAAARVSGHPNVVAIYDIGETESDPPLAFIVMELLTGGTLDERLKSGAPIPHAVALRWLGEAAAALDAAHACDVVHRDVKPANLLLDAQGTLKVGDFGIAMLASEAPLTQTGQVVGTAAYLSPEQALGRPATPASDRYALGVVAYELLTGRRPFVETSPAAQALAHVEAQAAPPSSVARGLPDGVDAVFARTLAKEPDARQPTAGQLVAELTAALGPTATTGVAHPERRFTRATPTPPAAAAGGERRSRLGAAAIAATVLLLAGVAVAALAGGGDTGTPKRTAAHHRTAHRHRAAATTAAAATTPGGAPPDAAGIEQQAHDALARGDAATAVGLLQPLVGRCPVEVTDPCAWAWFDLGYALLRDGQPAAAIAPLEHRLQNPDQRGTVEATLAQARAAAGSAAPAPPPPPGHGPGKAKGHDKLKD